MRKGKWLIAVACGAALLGTAGVAAAQVPRLMNFQGRLADKAGVSLTGTYSMTFSLWTAASGGTACFTQTLSVPASDGMFNVLIGSGVSGGISSCDFTAPYYLQVQVSGDASPMTPRMTLTAAAYTFNTDRLDGVDVDGFVAQDPATGNVVVTGKLGVGVATPTQALDANGYVKGSTGLCIGADCRTSWSASNGTVSSITAGTGIVLSQSPLTTAGSVSVNTTTIQTRVTGTCTTSQAISEVYSDGTVGCVSLPATQACTWSGKTYTSGATCYNGWANGTYCTSGNYDYMRCTCLSTGAWSCSDVSCSSLPVSCGN
jgi:hypothetical protein